MLKTEDNKSDEKKLIRLGQINFINCLPINYALDLVLDEEKKSLSTELDLELSSDTPKALNEKLRAGEIDAAPISSFEFLQNQSRYGLLGNLSVSSTEKADSVLLFSKEPIEKLSHIYLTNKSATSVALLKILLVKKYSLDLSKIKFTSFDPDQEDSFNIETKLLIGDNALTENKDNYDFVYDLGEEWSQMTKMPMVFGIWAYNKQSANCTDNKLRELARTLEECKRKGLGEFFPNVVIESLKQTGLTRSRLCEYFNNLDYDFTETHRQSLKLFSSYLLELGLLGGDADSSVPATKLELSV